MQAQVRVVGEHGHAVARRERGEELLGLADGAEETAQAAALEVLLEEEDEEAARGERRRRGAGAESTRATFGASATQTADSTAAARPSTSRRKSSGVEAGQRPSPRVGDPDLQDDTRGLDAGEKVGRLLGRAPAGSAARAARTARAEASGRHRADASTRPRAPAAVLASASSTEARVARDAEWRGRGCCGAGEGGGREVASSPTR